MTDRPFPAVKEGLVKALKELFPQFPPTQAETHADLMVRAGQSQVIEFLEEQSKR